MFTFWIILVNRNTCGREENNIRDARLFWFKRKISSEVWVWDFMNFYSFVDNPLRKTKQVNFKLRLSIYPLNLWRYFNPFRDILCLVSEIFATYFLRLFWAAEFKSEINIFDSRRFEKVDQFFRFCVLLDFANLESLKYCTSNLNIVIKKNPENNFPKSIIVDLGFL